MSFYKKIMLLLFLQLLVIYGLFFYFKDTHVTISKKFISPRIEQLEQINK